MICQSKYVLKISFMLSEVPIMNPAMPIIQIILFLKIMNAFAKPEHRFHFDTVSRNGGNNIPVDDRVNAPISEMNKSKFGITIAIKTAN